MSRLSAGSTSWVFDLPAGRVVLIVARPGRTSGHLAARVAAAGVLSARLPFVEPLDPPGRPVATSVGLHVTAWRRVDVRSGRPDWAAVGATVRALHEVAPAALAPTGLPLINVQQLTDVTSAVSALHGSGGLARRDAETLRRAADLLSAELVSLDPQRVVVHGDLHRPNILSTTQGCVLCDTDEIGLGSPDWDLGFLVDPGRRGSLDGAAGAEFERGYGRGLPDPANARTVARAAHLRRTVRQLAIERPTLRERAWSRARLDAWRDMIGNWSLDLQPVVGQPRGSLAVRRLRIAAGRSATR